MENNIFKNLNKLKQTIKNELLLNQNLLKLIVYPNGDPLSLPDIDSPQDLLNDYIYLNPIVWDKTISDVRTFLLTNVRVSPQINRNDFVNITIYFYIISHNDIYDLDNGDTRVISICDELMKGFNKADGDWIGSCEFKGFQEITARKDYYSVELKFVITDFKQ